MAQEQRLTEAESTAWRAFMQMQEVLRSRLEQQLQADSGLSNADYTILVALSDAPDGQMRNVELGRALGWEKSRLHNQLLRMCGRGLVERRAGAGRAVHTAITDAGRSALKAAVPQHTAQVRRLVLDRLSAEQLDQLRAISTAILDGTTPTEAS